MELLLELFLGDKYKGESVKYSKNYMVIDGKNAI
jgi:hypothetical protein